MTEKLKFENSNKLSSDELKELQNFKESDLDNLDKKQLEGFKKALIAEKQWYLERSKNKASKKRVSSLIDRVISAIDKKLSLSKESTTKEGETKTKKQNIQPNVEKNIDNNDEKESITKIEQEFNKRLESLLNPETTLIFTIGEKALIMEFDNPKQKREAEKLFLSLEKNFDDDKMAAYAVISFLHKYKNNIKSPKEIYMEAAKGLDGNQIVISKDYSDDFALLDVALNKNISTINVDTGNKFLNALFRTFFLPIDTASVEKGKLTNYLYGTKATSTWLWDRTKESKDDVYAFLDKPLKRFSKEKVMEELAQEVEDILTDDKKLQQLFNKKELSVAEEIALEYLKAHGITKEQLPAIDLKESFKTDDSIKQWMEKTKILDKFTSDKVAIEISPDGFLKVNPEAFNDNVKFVRIKLDKVQVGDKVEDKEALMEVNKISYDKLFGKQPNELVDKLSSLPPIILKDWTIIDFAKDGLYVIWEKVWNGVDALEDYLREHKLAAVAVSASILGSLITLIATDKLHVNINFEWIGKFFSKIGHWFEHIGELIKDWIKDTSDLITKFNPTKLEAFGLGYLVTALPLNYQIELWKEKYAKLYGDVKGAPSIDAELADATWGKVKLPSDEEIKEYVEAKNKFAHAVLTKLGVFEPGQATDVDYDVKVEGNGKYSILIHGRWEEAGSIIKLWNKTLYVDEWDTLEFDVKKHDDGTFTLQWINWEIKVDTFGKDDYIKFNGDKATYFEASTFGSDEKKKTVNVEWKSFEEIYKELISDKDKKNDKAA